MAALDKKPRLKLPVQQRPHYHEIRKGLALGYRRNKGAGTWLVRVADGKGNPRPNIPRDDSRHCRCSWPSRYP
jgi:hypothetical protein